MHHDTLNAGLYFTAATIIPVLFLALTLQGQTYDQLMNRTIEVMKRRAKDVTRQRRVLSFGLLAGTFASR